MPSAAEDFLYMSDMRTPEVPYLEVQKMQHDVSAAICTCVIGQAL